MTDDGKVCSGGDCCCGTVCAVTDMLTAGHVHQRDLSLTHEEDCVGDERHDDASH